MSDEAAFQNIQALDTGKINELSVKFEQRIHEKQAEHQSIEAELEQVKNQLAMRDRENHLLKQNLAEVTQ